MDQSEKARLEEEKMTETARGRAEEEKLENQVETEMKLWFKLNHDYLVRSK